MPNLSYPTVSDADVLLINPPYAQRYGSGLVPPMGLAYIASWLRQTGTQVRIVDLAANFITHDLPDPSRVAELTEAVLRDIGKQPRLIGVGPVVTANLRPARTIIQKCREAGPSTIIVGGPLCPVPGFPAVAAQYLNVDAYVCGDGERPTGEIWRRITANNGLKELLGVGLLPESQLPTAYREPDLNVLPIPARDLIESGYHMSARRTLGQTSATSAFLSRGCPYSCSFCSAPISSGRKVRRFSRERITKEISSCANLGFQSIVFYDDCLFVASRDLDNRVREFTGAIVDSGWRGKYQLELRCDAVMAMSDESLKLLRDSGCRQINMGIEKGHKAQLDLMRKRLTPEVASAACSRVSASGIRAAGTFILGGIGEVPDDLIATVDFARSLDLDFAQFNPLAVYPGTLLFQQIYGDRSDWLSLCVDNELAPFGDILWRSREVTIEQIAHILHVAYESFYSEIRLKRILARTPQEEHSALRSSYQGLRDSRARSWESLSSTQEVPAC